MKNLALLLPVFCFLMYSYTSDGQTAGTKKWEFLTGNDVNSSPAIGNDGTIYIGSLDKKLYAIKSDGSKKWEFLTGSSIYSSPAVGSDGTIYVGSDDYKLYAVNPDGTKKWEFLTGSYIDVSSPAIGPDGTIYVGSYDDKLWAINPNGTKKWEFVTGNNVTSSPAIGTDGTVYVGSNDNKLYAININGTKKWEFLTGSKIYSSPAIGNEGTIYVGSSDNKLYAVKPDGTKKWEFLTGGQVISSPAIGNDNTIYVGSLDNKLYAVKPDGSKKWEFLTGSSINPSSPAIGNDGIVYVGSLDDKLWAINPDGSKKWEFLTGNDVKSSPAIGTDGTVYVGSNDNKLYAIYSESKGLDTGPWPKFHKNNLNTGISVEMICDTRFNASFLTMNQTVPTNLKFTCTTDKIDVTKLTIDNSNFTLVQSLPMVKETGLTGFTVSMSLSNPGTALHQMKYQLTYVINGVTKTYSDSLKVATIVDNNTELSVVGKRAINAYNFAGDTAKISRISNQGVIYRLLGYPGLAKACFNDAVAMALTQKYGFTGIKMNQGVAESDLKKGTDATAIYDKAYSDVTAGKDVSILAPQITYNKAWELYTAGDCAGAESLANQTLNHAKANEWLKAKAAALLGAIKYCKGDVQGALQAFQTAYSLDLNGPIGALARENMQLINPAVEIEFDQDLSVYPQPAIDYFVIEYKGISQKEITVELTDLAGKTIYISKISPSGNTLLHSVDVKGFPPGVYLLTLTGESGKEMRKVLIQ